MSHQLNCDMCQTVDIKLTYCSQWGKMCIVSTLFVGFFRYFHAFRVLIYKQFHIFINALAYSVLSTLLECGEIGKHCKTVTIEGCIPYIPSTIWLIEFLIVPLHWWHGMSYHCTMTNEKQWALEVKAGSLMCDRFIPVIKKLNWWNFESSNLIVGTARCKVIYL